MNFWSYALIALVSYLRLIIGNVIMSMDKEELMPGNR